MWQPLQQAFQVRVWLVPNIAPHHPSRWFAVGNNIILTSLDRREDTCFMSPSFQRGSVYTYLCPSFNINYGVSTSN
jgi:hypothetical protein